MSNMNQAAPQRISLLNFIRQSNGGQFVIPIYQRNYTWGLPQVKKLLEDFENILEKKATSHFLGIIMYLEISHGISSREMSIVDGQQRLATTFLFLYALKNLADEKKEINLSGMIDDQYLTNKYVEDNAKFRLKPLISDDEVYKKIIDNELYNLTEKEKQSNVYINYIYIKNFIEENISSNDIKSSFDKLTSALDKMYIVYVPLLQEDNAQQIFESINSTGSPLLASDLIRNFILMNLESKKQDKYYKNYWYEIEKIFDNNSRKIEDFFRFYLSMNLYELSNKKEIYSTFKKWFGETVEKFNEEKNKILSNETENQEVALEYILSDILRYSQIYYKIYFSTQENLPSSILNYRKNLSEMPAPLIMKMYALFDEKKITETIFDKIVNLVDTYLMRRALANRPTSSITRIFPSILKQVLNRSANDFDLMYDSLLLYLVNNNINKSAAMPTDEDITNYLSTNNAYSLGIIRNILNEIEHLDNQAPVNLENLNIEHLMPQTADKENYWISKVIDGNYEEYVNLLGNLTLATKWDNSKMGNKDWEHKKNILEETSHLILNKDLLKLDNWDTNEIRKRNSELINKLLKIYPYSKSDNNSLKKWIIKLTQKDVDVCGYLYENGTVEISSNSLVKKGSSDLYGTLIEENIIKEIDDSAIFIEAYTFSSVSNAASFILNGSKNGWDFFTDENGNSLEPIRECIDNFKN